MQDQSTDVEMMGMSVRFFWKSIPYILCIIFAVTYHWVRWEKPFPDAFSYISVANEYLQGNFDSAVNGYWSPLLSWLMIPLMALGISGLGAIHIVLIIATVIALRVADLSLRPVIPNPLFRIFALSVCANLFAVLSIWVMSPDFLSVMLWAVAFWIYINKDRYLPINLGCLLGITGGLLYLAKAYNFYVFILCCIVIGLIDILWMKRAKPIVLKSSCACILVFIIICGVWIALISSKYGYATISTSGTWNSLYAAAMDQNLDEKLIFFKTPYENAFSVLNDRSYYIPELKKFTVETTFSGHITRIGRNIWEFIKIFGWFAWIFIPFAVYIKKKQLDFNFVSTLILFCLIYSAGYILLFIEFRYIMPVYYAAILLACYMLHELYCSLKGRFNVKILQITAIVGYFLFCSVSLYGWIGMYEKPDFTYIIEMKEHIPEKSVIITYRNAKYGHYAAYYNQYFHCGNLTDISLLTDDKIKEYGIDYLVVPKGESVDVKYPLIFSGEKVDIYSLKNS